MAPRRRGQGYGGPGRKTAPRALTRLEEAILAEGARKIDVRQNGESSQMEVTDIIARKMAETAAKGSPHAQRLWVDSYVEAATLRDAGIAEQIEVWCSYQRHERARIEAARKAGVPLPEPLPHPDDLEFDPKVGVRFLGPVTAEEVRVSAHIGEYRDHLSRQDALEARLGTEKGGRSVPSEPSSALLLANIMNQLLPPRLQISADEFVSQMMEAHQRPKRVLLKETCQGWKRQHLDFPRGTVLAPAADLKEALELLGDTLADLRALPRVRDADCKAAAEDLGRGLRAIGRRRRAKMAQGTELAAPPKG